MSKVTVELSMSLDGFIAGPNDGQDNGLGDGGARLFKWHSSGDTDFPLPGNDAKTIVRLKQENLV